MKSDSLAAADAAARRFVDRQLDREPPPTTYFRALSDIPQSDNEDEAASRDSYYNSGY